MTVNQLISQCQRATLLCDVDVGFVSIYYGIGKLTEGTNCRYPLPDATNLTQLHYIEVRFVLWSRLWLEDVSLSVCDAVLLDECLPKFWGNPLSSLFKTEAVQFILWAWSPARDKASTTFKMSAHTHRTIPKPQTVRVTLSIDF